MNLAVVAFIKNEVAILRPQFHKTDPKTDPKNVKALAGEESGRAFV